ncbi:MAG: DUF2179 domain-containing protein [Deltaproteobacteria bacterium]|nr:DUF2179 domain-containing protein [Candidatus Zymogenaceae bacterium]
MFQYVVIPLLIFLARISDVTIGTLRIIYVAKGLKIIASFLGFFEVLIWLIALGQIIQNLTNPINYLAYAGGFATGVFLGVVIEEKLSVGIMQLRIITKKDAARLMKFLKHEGYGITRVNAQGAFGPVDVIYTIVQRKEIPHLIQVIRAYNPNAVYSVEEVKHVSKSPFPNKKGVRKIPFGFFRKGK